MEYESIRSYGLRNPVAVIPNGVNYNISTQEWNEFGEHFFARYPELKGKKILLFLSRLSWEKGLPLLADSWGRLARQFPEWHLVIAGAGTKQYEVDIKNQFIKKGVSKQITWTGLLKGNDKFGAFGAAELFILPTHSENFGIAVAEALAAGVPAITTHGAPWKELSDNKCGWWVPINIDDITAALYEGMAMSIEERRAMGARGRRLISDKYIWPAIGSQMGDVYKWLLGQADMPSCVILG